MENMLTCNQHIIWTKNVVFMMVNMGVWIYQIYVYHISSFSEVLDFLATMDCMFMKIPITRKGFRIFSMVRIKKRAWQKRNSTSRTDVATWQVQISMDVNRYMEKM